MAWVFSGTNRVTLTYIDKAGRQATRTFGWGSAALPTALDTAADAITFDAMSNGKLIKMTFSFDFIDDAAPAVAPDDSHADDYAILTAKLADRPERHGINVPMLNELLYAGTEGALHDVVNTAHATVQAFEALLDGTTRAYTVSDGEFIESIVSGKRGR